LIAGSAETSFVTFGELDAFVFPKALGLLGVFRCGWPSCAAGAIPS
jgi:hypothetical protein